MTRRMLSLEGRTLLLCSLLALAGTLLGILMAGYLREPLLAVLLSALIARLTLKSPSRAGRRCLIAARRRLQRQPGDHAPRRVG